MDLDHGQPAGQQGVEQGHRGMGEGGRIDDQPGGGGARVLHPIDHLGLAVRLPEIHRQIEGPRLGHAQRLDLGEGLVAVNLGLAASQQIQVGAVENQNGVAHGMRLVGRRFISGRIGNSRNIGHRGGPGGGFLAAAHAFHIIGGDAANPAHPDHQGDHPRFEFQQQPLDPPDDAITHGDYGRAASGGRRDDGTGNSWAVPCDYALVPDSQASHSAALAAKLPLP